MSAPVQLFCSCSDKDLCWQQDLEVHLAVLRRGGLVDSWHRRLVGAGERRDEAILKRMRAAKIVLLLLSADYLSCDDCYQLEMGEALELHRSGEARVLCILIRSFDSWGELPFATLPMLSADRGPIAECPNRDAAWAEVVASIRGVAEEGRSGTSGTESVVLPGSGSLPATVPSSVLVATNSALGFRSERVVLPSSRVDELLADLVKELHDNLPFLTRPDLGPRFSLMFLPDLGAGAMLVPELTLEENLSLYRAEWKARIFVNLQVHLPPTLRTG